MDRSHGRAGAVVLGIILIVIGCTDVENNPAWTLAGEPGLLYTVKQYYERHASEENGLCTAPLLDAVTQTRVVEETDERLELVLRYRYRDWIRDGDDDCDEGRPLRCAAFLAICRGFAQRSFVVARGEEGFEVVEMSGEHRRAPWRSAQ